MAVADLRQALDLAEQVWEVGGRVKGYKVYGKLSGFTLTDVSGILEKIRGSGVFALFYPKVFEHVEGQEWHKGMVDEVMSASGSVLVYIQSEDYLGKDVCISLTKKTSLCRLNHSNDSGCIVSWNKRKGSDTWEIIPTEVKVIDKKNAKIREYMTVGKKGVITYTKSHDVDDFKKVEWLGNSKIVSSAPIRLPVKRRIYTSNEIRPWKKANTIQPNPDISQIMNNIRKLEIEQKKATRKQGKFIKELVATCRSNREDMKKVSVRIINGFVKSCLSNWETFGKESLTKLLELLDDVTESVAKKKTIHEFLYVLHQYMPYFPDKCQGMFLKKQIAPNQSALAVLIISHIAGVKMSRMFECIKRVSMNKLLFKTEDCLYLVLNDPYTLALLGAGIKYEDCVRIQSTIKSKSYTKTTKEVLYALDCYRKYTKESNYRDMLIGEDEWLAKEKMIRSKEVYQEKTATLYLNDLSDDYSLAIPEALTPEECIRKPNIEDFSPITTANIPHIRYYEPNFHHILTGLVDMGIVWEMENYFIPTYESKMELDFAKKIIENRSRMSLVYSSDFSKLEGYIQKVADDKTVYIGDIYIKNTKMSYRYRPPYVEPVYLCGVERNENYLEKSEEPVKYIVGDVDDYSLWEMSTLMKSVGDTDEVIFLADTSKKPPTKGVSVLPLLEMLLHREELHPTESEYLSNKLTYNKETLLDYDIYADNNIYNLCKGTDFSVVVAKEDIEIHDKVLSLIDKKDWDNFRLVSIGEEARKKYNKIISGKVNAGETPIFYLKGNPYFRGDKIIYTGRTNTEKPRYTVNKINGENIFEEVETKGLSKRHELRLIDMVSILDVNYEDKPKMLYAKNEVLLLCGLHDSILDKDVYLFFRGRFDPSTKELRGEIENQIEIGYVQDIHYMARHRVDEITVIVEKLSKLCRQDISSALSRARIKVGLLGDVGRQKCALGNALELVYPKQRRVLFSKFSQVEGEEQ